MTQRDQNASLKRNDNQGEQRSQQENSGAAAAAPPISEAGLTVESERNFDCHAFFTDHKNLLLWQATKCLMKCVDTGPCSEDVVSNYKADLVKKPNKNFLEASDEERVKISMTSIKYKSLDQQEKCKCEKTYGLNDDIPLVNPRNIQSEIENEDLLKKVYSYLNEDERFIFHSCMVVENSYAAVGKILGLSAQTVSRKFSRIKEKVEKKFNN